MLGGEKIVPVPAPVLIREIFFNSAKRIRYRCLYRCFEIQDSMLTFI
jgi:hypothetical protein